MRRARNLAKNLAKNSALNRKNRSPATTPNVKVWSSFFLALQQTGRRPKTIAKHTLAPKLCRSPWR
jgi:hypothetical protein